MYRRVRALVFFFATSATVQVHASEYAETLQEMRRIDTDYADPARKAPLLEQSLSHISASVASRGLAQLDDDEVRDVYDAARVTAYYAYSASAARTQQAAWIELDRRAIAPAGSGDEVVEALIAARLFDDSAAFYRAHRAAVRNPPPRYVRHPVRSGEPVVLQVSRRGDRIEPREFVLPKGVAIVVVSSPWCPYSRAAVQAIESDAQLAGIMARHAQWVIPQQIIHDLRSVAEWNRQHPTMPKTLIDRQRDWHFLTSTATPTFHFFRDGKLVATLSGWPGAAQKDALRAELDRVGLSVSK